MSPVVEWRQVTDQILGRLGTQQTWNIETGTWNVNTGPLPVWTGIPDPDAAPHGIGDLTGVNIYDGDVPDTVPVDDTGHVTPYVVVRSTIGPPLGERGLRDETVDSLTTYTLTCVAGWRADCEQLAASVHAVLFRWSPTLAGHDFGQMEPPPGYSPPVLPDRDVTPVRFYVPLQYRLTVTR